MNRGDFMDIFVRHRDGAPAITGPGATSGMLWAAGHDEATIYNMEMAYATPMCLGVALARPDLRVVSLEGEGSAIAGMPVFASIARYRPENFVVVVFDNKVFGTGGAGVETASAHGVDIAGIARACGLEQVHGVSDVETAEDVVASALSRPGPWIIIAEIDTSDSLRRPLPEPDHVETAASFRRVLSGRRSS